MMWRLPNGQVKEGQTLKRAVGILGISVLWLVAGSVNASASTDTGHEGTVTGWAGPCVGTATPAQYARTPFVVILIQGPRLVAHQKLHGKSLYRFNAAAGSYTLAVSVNGLASGSVIPNHRVTFRPGQLVHVNLVPSCK